MMQSHVITVDGAFVGVAVRSDGGYRFVAIDGRLTELDATIWPTFAHLERLARRLFRTRGTGPRRAAPPPCRDPALQVGG